MNAERENTSSKPDSPDEVPLYTFWQPRYWLLWIGLLILRVLILLPGGVRLFVSRLLGRLGLRLAPERKRIAAVNLSLCFPELEPDDREKLLVKHFESLALGLFDLAMCAWSDDARVQRLIHIEGMENILEPIKAGRNVVILSGHFAAIELTGRQVYSEIGDVAAMYRPTRNPFLDQILRRGRKRAASMLIPKDSLRQLIRGIKTGTPVWYAPDQSYNRAYHALVPFFGEPAMTNAALTHIARITDALVVPYFSRRVEDGLTYSGEFLPALENFPSGDAEADALRINKFLEEKIRLAPEQYYWVHRRFKDRPAPYPDPYARTDIEA